VTAVESAAGSRLYVELLGPSGSAVRHGDVAAPGADRPLDVYFPGRLAAGRHELVVREGKEGRELARSTFDIVP